MSTPNYAEWRKLCRSDLTTFDDVMTNIVLEYMELGWLGKMSKKGHAILHAPDGENTTSVSRSSGRGGSGTRARADIERWKANRPGRAFGIPLVPEKVIFDDRDDYERFGVVMRDPKIRDHLRMMRDAGYTMENADERILLNTSNNTSEKENWYAVDPMTRTAIAWGKDLTEERVYEVHYGTTTLEKPVTEPDYQSYVCGECGEVLDSKNSLGGHMNGHKPKVRCEVEDCGWEGVYIESHLTRKHPLWAALSEESRAEVRDLIANGDTVYATDIEEIVADVEPEPMSEPSGTLDPLTAMQALIDEVQASRVRQENFTEASEEIASLRAELAAVTLDRDHYKAKVDVLREALEL